MVISNATVTLSPLPDLNTPVPQDCPDDSINPTPKPVPAPPVILGDGLGNLIYLVTLKGLAGCFQAYGTNGTDGAPVWFSCNGTTPYNLTGDALKIRWFELDLFSDVTDGLGTHMQTGLALTDDGIYRVTGLPLAPVWTQTLSLSDAATMLGLTAANLIWGNNVAQNLQQGGFWMCPVIDVTTSKIYTVWSTDDGQTWAGDGSKFFTTFGMILTPHLTGVWVQCSLHIATTVYVIMAPRSAFNSSITGNQDGAATEQDISVAGVAFPDFDMTRGVWLATSPGVNRSNYKWLQRPYNEAGQYYIDDNAAYLLGTASGDFLAITNALFTVAPPAVPPYTNISPDSNAYNDIDCNVKNSNYVIAVRDSAICVSNNQGGTWVTTLSPGVSGRTFESLSVFCVPANHQVAFFGGKIASGGGYGACFHTPDGGVTWVDDSLYSQAGSLDSIMGLALTDLAVDNCRVLVDRHYTGSVTPSGAATMIDVSHYQGAMNWATAKAAGITHTFIKASQGIATTDDQYSTNWTGAGTQSISRGPYHYYMNASDPTDQANHYLSVIGSNYGELGPAVDCEDETDSLDPANLKIFLDRIETVTGHKCVIYTRASWWNSYVGFQSWAADYPLWVANWGVSVPSLPDGWMTWAYWQYSSMGKGSDYGAASQFIDLDRVLGG